MQQNCSTEQIDRLEEEFWEFATDFYSLKRNEHNEARLRSEIDHWIKPDLERIKSGDPNINISHIGRNIPMPASPKGFDRALLVIADMVFFCRKIGSDTKAMSFLLIATAMLASSTAYKKAKEYFMNTLADEIDPTQHMRIVEELEKLSQGFESYAKKANLERSRKGGWAKASKWKPVEELIFQEYSKKKWNSKRQAAKYIEPKAKELAESLNITISENGIFDTVYRIIRRGKS